MRRRVCSSSGPVVGGLAREALEVLLTGTCEADPFVLFDRQSSEWAALWRAHRAAVLAEARRRGVERPWGLRFDDEGDHAA